MPKPNQGSGGQHHRSPQPKHQSQIKKDQHEIPDQPHQSLHPGEENSAGSHSIRANVPNGST
jgi:hypothetical protein